jgi:hypothetical protein
MGLTGLGMKPLTHYLLPLHHYGPHEGIGGSVSGGPLGQVDAAPHHGLIKLGGLTCIHKFCLFVRL